MDSEKGMYWIAVGFLALVVTNNFTVRQEFAAHIADRSFNTAQQIVNCSTRYLSTMHAPLAGKPGCPRAEMAMGRAESRQAELQTVLAFRQTERAHDEAQRARMIALRNLKSADVFLPQQDFTIEVSENPDSSDGGSL